jgi:hypothetical protein
MLPLAIGTLLAVGALAYVLFPLLFGTPVRVPRRVAVTIGSERASEHDAVVALREIEFDRVTGKLSDADYAELKTRYTERALAAGLRRRGAGAGGGRRRGGGARVSRAAPELCALWAEAGARCRLLLELRHVSRREVCGVRACRRGGGSGVLRRMRAAARGVIATDAR